jgi:hypothetical protein
MMTKDRDYEDILRRALAEAAESIEPTGDGLRRIRHRLDSPRSLRSVFSGCSEWLELHGIRFLIRLDPAIEAARAALSRAQSAWGPLGALAGLLGGRGRRRRAGGHRGAASPPGRLGSAGPWLKPVFAVSAAVAIVAVGVVILNHEKGTLINPANNVGTAEPSSSVASGGTAANSGLPLFIKPGPQSTGPTQNNSATNPVPAVVCTPLYPHPHPHPRHDPDPDADHHGTDRERQPHSHPDGERNRDQYADNPAHAEWLPDAYHDGERNHGRRHGHDDRRGPIRPEQTSGDHHHRVRQPREDPLISPSAASGAFGAARVQAQRPARLSRIAAAAIPADEVRSTVGPSRAATAPA